MDESQSQHKNKHTSDHQAAQLVSAKSAFHFPDNRFRPALEHGELPVTLKDNRNATKAAQKKSSNTGLPDNLKSGIENLSGYSMDDVKVHYNSNKPAQLSAHAYAQGTDIHIASGQEKHLAHEAWHVVQQKQGRVKPTMQLRGKINVNDDTQLEEEADIMGAKAISFKKNKTGRIQKQSYVQMMQVTQLMLAGDQAKFTKFLKPPIDVQGFKSSLGQPYVAWLKATSYQAALQALAAFVTTSNGDASLIQAELKRIADVTASDERYAKGGEEIAAAAAASAAVIRPSGKQILEENINAAGATMVAEDNPAQLPVPQGTFIVTSGAMHAGLKTWGAVVCSVVGMQVQGTSICALAHFDSSSNPATAIPEMLRQVRQHIPVTAAGGAAAAASHAGPKIDVFVASRGGAVALAADHSRGLDVNQLFSQIMHALQGHPDLVIHNMGRHPVDVDAGINARGFFIIDKLRHNNLNSIRRQQGDMIHAAVEAHRHLQILPTLNNNTGREGEHDARVQIAALGGLKHLAPAVLRPMHAADADVVAVLDQNYNALIAKQREMISQQLLLIHNTRTSNGDTTAQVALLHEMEILLEEMKTSQEDANHGEH